MPSVTIGTHVLTLGMNEAAVLGELRGDFTLQSISGSVAQSSSWTVSQKMGPDDFRMVGNVAFTQHKLVDAIRYWHPDEASSKSLFYAMNEAIQSLEREGLTRCQVSTSTAGRVEGSPSGDGAGSVNTKQIVIDCGVKQVTVMLNLSDVPGFTPTDVVVLEWLRRR